MECYENLRDYDAILRTIDQYRGVIPKENRLEYLKKYFPLVLAKLVNNVDFDEPENMLKTKEKKAKVDEVKAIEEEEDEDDSDDFLSESDVNEENEEEKEEEAKIEAETLIEQESVIEQSMDLIQKEDKMPINENKIKERDLTEQSIIKY